MIPLVSPGGLPKPDDLREILAFIGKRRADFVDFDVVEINWTTGVNRERTAEKVSQYAEAGITWWLESLYTMKDSPERMLKRIRRGPPTI